MHFRSATDTEKVLYLPKDHIVVNLAQRKRLLRLLEQGHVHSDTIWGHLMHFRLVKLLGCVLLAWRACFTVDRVGVALQEGGFYGMGFLDCAEVLD